MISAANHFASVVCTHFCEMCIHFIFSGTNRKSFSGARRPKPPKQTPCFLRGKYTLFFIKNNFIRTTSLKFAQKLRTSSEQLRIGFRCKCNCKLLLKNTSHHVITFGVSMQVFLKSETLIEQRKMIKTVLPVFYDSAKVYIRQ